MYRLLDVTELEMDDGMRLDVVCNGLYICESAANAAADQPLELRPQAQIDTFERSEVVVISA